MSQNIKCRQCTCYCLIPLKLFLLVHGEHTCFSIPLILFAVVSPFKSSIVGQGVLVNLIIQVLASIADFFPAMHSPLWCLLYVGHSDMPTGVGPGTGAPKVCLSWLFDHFYLFMGPMFSFLIPLAISARIPDSSQSRPSVPAQLPFYKLPALVPILYLLLRG